MVGHGDSSKRMNGLLSQGDAGPAKKARGSHLDGGNSRSMGGLLAFQENSPAKCSSAVDTRAGSSTATADAGPAPLNGLVTPMLTDMYQISMTYAHWTNEKHLQPAVFDLFFRKCPFQGEFCIFAGLDEVLKFLTHYHFSESDIAYLQELMPAAEPAFFQWLSELDCSAVKVFAADEGSVVFPKEPLLRIEAPLGIGQLLETTLLNLVNYASLVTTNACRMRIAAGEDKQLMEFGLRRAQGPDGALSASKYSFMGGFDGTSNVQAGKLCGIKVSGTHAHAYVMSYTGLQDLHHTTVASKDDPSQQVEFLQLCLDIRESLGFNNTNVGELAAFISYAQAYPAGLLALVDTYDTLHSGIPNFLVVSEALRQLGYDSIGIRLDSGDLAYLSQHTREMWVQADSRLQLDGYYRAKKIVASNDLSEDVIWALKQQKHDIDVFGIGTNLVTCQKQPALGCVFKLVEINGAPRIKLSQDVEKLVLPGKKSVYRLYDSDGSPLVDLMQSHSEAAPEAGKRIMVRHPFVETKRAFVTPARVESALRLVWDAQQGQVAPTPSLAERREVVLDHVKSLRSDHIRHLNPTPYKVAVSPLLYQEVHQLWSDNAPIPDL